MKVVRLNCTKNSSILESSYLKYLIDFRKSWAADNLIPYNRCSSMQETFSEELTAIRVPKAIEERIKQRLPKTDFTNVSEYASYVLDSVLKEIEQQGTTATDEGKSDTDFPTEKSPFSEKDQEDVEQRLRDLGYL